MWAITMWLMPDLLQEQISQIVPEQGITAAEAEEVPLALETQEMLRKWEPDDPRLRFCGEQMMNNWVYEGFFETYKLLGCDYEKPYYKSRTRIWLPNLW